VPGGYSHSNVEDFERNEGDRKASNLRIALLVMLWDLLLHLIDVRYGSLFRALFEYRF
jgi:hypothetical protein